MIKACPLFCEKSYVYVYVSLLCQKDLWTGAKGNRNLDVFLWIYINSWLADIYIKWDRIDPLVTDLPPLLNPSHSLFNSSLSMLVLLGGFEPLAKYPKSYIFCCCLVSPKYDGERVAAGCQLSQAGKLSEKMQQKKLLY